MNANVRVRREIVEKMLAEARAAGKLECCGLLAGKDEIITHIFPARNALESATAYEIAPKELFGLFRKMREEGLEHLGIYHSHPAGENRPSPTDIAQAYYPDVAYFILSPLLNAPKPVRAFWIREGDVTELVIEAED